MRIVTHHTWLAWLAIASGALYAISNAQDIDTVAETRHWPTTRGTMVASDIVSEEVGTYMGKWSNRPMYAVRLHLTYVYHVAGNTYTGTRWNALPASSIQATHAMLREYAPGRGVVVHYDAHNPSSAVLDTSWPIRKYVALVCSLVLMVGVYVTTRIRRVTV